jgi:hypothetical protein
MPTQRSRLSGPFFSSLPTTSLAPSSSCPSTQTTHVLGAGVARTSARSRSQPREERDGDEEMAAPEGNQQDTPKKTATRSHERRLSARPEDATTV